MDRDSMTWTTKDELAYLEKIGASLDYWKKLDPLQKMKKKIKKTIVIIPGGMNNKLIWKMLANMIKLIIGP